MPADAPLPATPATPAAPADKRSWWIPSMLGITVGLVLLATTFNIHIKADDVWWHLKVGEVIVTQQEIPDRNLFSFTAPAEPWLAHEWLSEVVFYLVHRGLGDIGLIFLGIVLNALACGLVYRLCVRYSGSPFLSSAITLLAALMLLGNFSLRPYLFGNLFFIATLHALEEPAAGGRLRPALIFLIFGTWANFHGSFILGLALIAIYAAASLARHLQGPPRPYKDLRGFGLDFLVALTACVFTPHHVFGLIFPFTYLQNALSGKATFLTNISEWQSAGFDTPLGSMIIYYLMFCLFAIFGSGLVPSPVHVGLLVAFGFFAFATIRNIPLLGIVATPVLARHLPRALSNAWKLLARVEPLQKALERVHRSSVSLDRRAHWLPVPLLWAIFMALSVALPARSLLSFENLTKVRALQDLSPAFYPEGLLEHLAANGQGRRVFNYFNWGGAFIHRLYPGIRVFIDQRNDCYPMTVFEDYFAVHELGPDWRTVLDRWRIDAVAYPPDSALAKMLEQDSSWRIEYRDAQAVLFVRATPAPAPAQDAPPVSDSPDTPRPSSREPD